MRKRRTLAVTMAAICATTLFAACGGGGEPADGSGTESSAPSSTVSSSATGTPEESAPASSAAGTEAPASSAAASASEPELQTVKLTFAEGATVARIIDTLDEKGVAEQKSLFDAVASADFSDYPLVAAIAPDERRCFRLEGYLFPDTYEFYIGEAPESVLKKLLDNAEKRLTQELRDRAAELGRSMDEILTIASIVQKETGQPEQMPEIASILHNRLEQGMRLQCDVTITYVEGAIKPYIDGDVNRYNAYYNTYKCAALPAGPICNPGMDAIRAALWPDETDYLFFAYDTEGNYYYASTYEQHLKNLADAGIR